MVVNGITVAFKNQEKRRKRMKAYQDYINQLIVSKRNNQINDPVIDEELTENQKGHVE